MQYTHLRHADLNLLQPLLVLLEERHITRAAARCFLSQPAMSRVLDRLRESFGDDLLIRNGRGYERTARGERLLHELESLLPCLESLVRGERFDAVSSTDLFRLAMTDYGSALMLPPLMRRICGLAPGVGVEVAAWHDGGFEEVETGKLDMALTIAEVPSSLASEVLFEDEFVCLVAADHPFRGRRFTLAQYVAYPHALMNVAGQHALVDQPLGEHGVRRRVALRAPYLLSVVPVVATTRIVITVPRRLADAVACNMAVRMVRPPLEVKKLRYAAAWHPRLATDPAHVWFREQLRAVAAGI